MLYLLFFLGMVFATPTPPPLEGWAPWLLKDTKNLDCPILNGNRHCFWMGRLDLELQNDGARFQQRLHIDKNQPVSIVGGIGQWPFAVKVNGQLTPVIDMNGRPYVILEKGSHQITGELTWNATPSSVQVPKGLAQIECLANGQPQNTQYSTTEGVLRIGQDEMESQVQLRVLRRIEDGHPTVVETLIWLTSTGGHQAINIGNPFLDGAHPLKIDSRLGTQLTENQNLIVQPLPGEHLIRIHSLFPEAPSVLKSAGTVDIWPDVEHWIFLPDPKLRTLQVGGAATVDRERASLPDEWTENSVYQISPSSGLVLNELHRGDPQPPPNQLRLNRHIWLDSDGYGLSIQDEISGKFYQSWRLSRSNQANLGRVSVDDMPQVITTFNGESGVEIRQSTPTIVAESRIEELKAVSTVGWNIQPESLSIQLHLPPGWQLISAGGGAEVENGFWNNTLLLKIILIFAVAGIIGKLSKRRWGIVLGAALLFYSNWSVALLIYTSCSLIVLAYQNEHHVIRWIRRVVLFFFAIYLLDLGYTEATQIQHPSSDSTQNIQQSPTRYTKVLEDYGERGLDSISRRQITYQQNIPNAIAQTGMGIPSWVGETYLLTWNDKWIPSDELDLVLLSPGEKRLLDSLRLFLLFFGVWNLLGLRLPKPEHVAALLLSFVGISTAHADELPFENDSTAHEQSYFENLLSEYKAQLIAPPDCGSHCTNTNQLILDAEGQSLRIQGEVHSLVPSYWLLPGTTAQYHLRTIRLNGQISTDLHQDANGHIAIRLPEGVTIIEAELELLSAGATAFELHQTVQHLSFHSEDWSIEGLRPNHVPEPMIKLIPEQDSGTQSLQPYSMLERQFDIGHQWRVHNTLRRNPNAHGPLTVNIPLLPEEKILNPNILVSEAQAIISLSSEDTAVEWTSLLPSGSDLSIQASDGQLYTETWTFLCAVMHHCELENLVASQHITDGLWMPIFQPQPNEQINLKVQELGAATGQIRTIDQVNINHHIGANSIQSDIELNVRAATEGNIILGLPSTQITHLSLNSSDIPIVQDGENLQIPHGSGDNRIRIESSLAQKGIFLEIPSPSLPDSAVNISLSLESGPYWLLHVFAPPWGSQSLLPLNIVCWLILAFILAKIPRSPLNIVMWFGLYIITIPVSIVLPLILSLPLLITHLIEPNHLMKRFARLAFFSLFLIAAAGMLIYAIMERPQLLTTDGLLEWQIDRSTGQLPSLQILQVPRIAWKGVVLCWAAFVGRIIWTQGQWLDPCIRDIIQDMTRKAVKPSNPQPSLEDGTADASEE